MLYSTVSVCLSGCLSVWWGKVGHCQGYTVWWGYSSLKMRSKVRVWGEKCVTQLVVWLGFSVFQCLRLVNWIAVCMTRVTSLQRYLPASIVPLSQRIDTHESLPAYICHWVSVYQRVQSDDVVSDADVYRWHCWQVSINNGLTNTHEDYDLCVRAENVELPRNFYFGVTAATGALAGLLQVSLRIIIAIIIYYHLHHNADNVSYHISFSSVEFVFFMSFSQIRFFLASGSYSSICCMFKN